jgi:uncharacterized membrane protein
MATAVTKGIARRAVRATAKHVGGRAVEAIREAGGALRERTSGSVGAHVRSLPIQCSIDVAVPVEVAWEEWMALEFLPEGMHRVEEIEWDGDDVLLGGVTGTRRDADWEAEVVDERENESFAWRSYEGADVAGLVTFHALADRLTRLELELDVVPSRFSETAGLALHLADRRAQRDLRAFKARVEMISPDDYPPLEEEDEADDQEEEQE